MYQIISNKQKLCYVTSVVFIKIKMIYEKKLIKMFKLLRFYIQMYLILRNLWSRDRFLKNRMNAFFTKYIIKDKTENKKNN